ncbi:MAG TPA: TatD family deoxyribonuclease [Acidobacteria bacterium]|jgi:TatD DNase family protein|nr:TatD family deoxyribonuclease [Acidobacteriota bacterium]
MLDSHCHLADQAFSDDLPEVVTRAQQAGVETALCILAAGDVEEEARAEVLRNLWPSVSFACGIHPHQANTWAGREATLAAYVRGVVEQQDDVLAIGEIGLDYHYDFAPIEVQRKVFASQVALARELKLPLVIHSREAEADTWAILREAGDVVAGVLHCFTGDAKAAQEALALGLHVSFSGIVTFSRAESLREIAGWIPEDRLLVETDSPYLAPVPYRGHRNEPAWVERVVEVVARARRVEPDMIEVAVLQNFKALFSV